MLSLGIDAVEIKRFSHWHKYTKNQLKRIFSDSEINYCLNNPIKSAERFALRFAAKEAFYKAISPLLVQPITLLQTFKYIQIIKNNGAPYLYVQWEALNLLPFIKCPKVHISLTHTTTTAIAVIAIYESIS